MSGYRQRLARFGERAVADYYEFLGYRVLDMNWRCREGELDVVAFGCDTVVFVEVKTRTTDRYGSGFEAVDANKQRQLRKLALLWLADSDHGWSHLRFDVADVDRTGFVDVLESAF